MLLWGVCNPLTNYSELPRIFHMWQIKWNLKKRQILCFFQKTEVNMLLFIADNLACFPYQSQEEPLFIMHHIDITLSVSGSNLLQTFREVC